MKPQRYFLFFTLLVIAGCASLEPAQSFSQKFAYAIGVHTAILQATTSAVEAGTIHSSDAQSILVQADQAKTVLDVANAAYAAGDEAGANSKLAIALTSLTALQEYLRTHGAQ